jgi:hypothetical protein
MIRTKCPHCSKLLGINESAAGTVALCPVCKKKFRVPGTKANPSSGASGPRAGSPPAEEDFPELEVVEEGDGVRSKPAPAKGTSRKPSPADEEEVALRDEDEVEVGEHEDGPRPKKGPRKGKKKKADEASALMVMRYRIVGAVGALWGFGILAYGLLNEHIPKISDHFHEPGRYVVIGFGGLMGVVGLFYVFRPAGGK